jgi:tetratricopeptide (TPR) repeat protein
LRGTYVAFLVGLAIEWIWQLAAVAAVGLAALGALVSASEEKRSSLRVWTLPRNLVVAVGVATSALMLIGFVYERRLSASYDAAARGDIAGALAAAADARAVEPWATPARLQLALLLERKGALDSADRELGAAIARMRQDWQLWLVRSRIELELGHGRQARAALRRAAALNPNSALFTGVSGR